MNQKCRAQRYFVPDLNKEIKVESISNKIKVAHLPEGLERISPNEMTNQKWVHVGPWEADTRVNTETERTCANRDCAKTYPLTNEYFHKKGNGLHFYCKACACEKTRLSKLKATTGKVA